MKSNRSCWPITCLGAWVCASPTRRPQRPNAAILLTSVFLQLAIAGKAHYPASGDKDLPSLMDQFDCPIVTVDQFLETLGL